MAGSAFLYPVGGFWPLGLITVATAGTAVPINTNVGTQLQGGSTGAIPTMSKRLRQLIVSAPSTNTGQIYVVKKGYNKTKTNGVVAIVQKGTTIPLPWGLLDGAMPAPDDLELDADTSGDKAFVTAIYG